MTADLIQATPSAADLQRLRLTPRLPSATYRLQFNRLFTFADARRRLEGARCPLVVGVTGSNGKTTTKELVAAALAPRGPGYRK